MSVYLVFSDRTNKGLMCSDSLKAIDKLEMLACHKVDSISVRVALDHDDEYHMMAKEGFECSIIKFEVI